jgi:hypothetical protein
VKPRLLGHRGTTPGFTLGLWWPGGGSPDIHRPLVNQFSVIDRVARERSFGPSTRCFTAPDQIVRPIAKADVAWHRRPFPEPVDDLLTGAAAEDDTAHRVLATGRAWGDSHLVKLARSQRMCQMAG